MELTPLSRVLLRLRGIILCLPLSWVVLGRPALDLSFILWFGGTFALLQIGKSKVSLLLFKIFLDLDHTSVCRAEREDVQEFHFILDVPVRVVKVLENQILLRILDTQLCAKGMKNIGKLWHILVPSLSQRCPLYVFILIALDRVVLSMMASWNGFQVDAAENSEFVLSSFCSQ